MILQHGFDDSSLFCPLSGHYLCCLKPGKLKMPAQLIPCHMVNVFKTDHASVKPGKMQNVWLTKLSHLLF